jgi:hypothetical protein
MAVEQGITTTLAYKVQSALGTAATGSGGQLLRRITGSFDLTKDTYSNAEIVSHQQHTGDIHGVRKTAATLNCSVSPLSYKDLIAAGMRKAWAATSAITGLTLTIAASGSGYTVTRSTGDFLTGGIKIGDVVVLTGGSLAAGNINVNLLVTGVTALVLTVLVPTGTALTAEGPITTCTVTATGKKTWVPTTGHTNLYYTFEENFAGITRYHLYKDVQVGMLDVTIPATGICTANIGLVGLGSRVASGSQTLTTPTAETTSAVLSSLAGAVVIGGTRYTSITSANISIDFGVTQGEAVVGSNTIPDNQRSRIKVSGTFTALYESDTLSTIFSGETTTSLILMLADDSTDTADFMTFVMPQVKLFSDTRDDGEKQIIRTFNFTAEICSSTTGGTSLANHQTILSIQDSLA